MPSTNPENDKRDPFRDVNSEKAILGGYYVDAVKANGICDKASVTPDMFIDEQCRQAFIACRKMMTDGSGHIDPIILREKQNVPLAFFESCCDEAYTMWHFEDYVDNVIRCSQNRKLSDVISEARGKLLSGNYDPECLRGETEARFARLSDNTEPLPTARQAMDAQRELYVNAQSTGCAGLRTGHFWWDTSMGGLMPGGYYVVSGKGKSFKTTIVRNIAESVAGKSGLRVDMASLEQSSGQIYSACAARIAGVTLMDLMTGRDHGALKRWDAAAEVVAKWPFVIDDKPKTAESIWSWARMAKAKGTRLLIVDYLQFIKNSETRINEEQRVARASSACREIALYMKLPVIAIASEANGEDGGIRHSGQVAYDCTCHIKTKKSEDGKVGAIVSVRLNRFGLPMDDTELLYKNGALLCANMQGEYAS
jgi:replicative DNA helicase